MESIHNCQFTPLSFKIALSVQSQFREIQEEKSIAQKVCVLTKLAAGALIGTIETLFFITLSKLTKKLSKEFSNDPHILKLHVESQSGYKKSQEIFTTIKKIFADCLCITCTQEIENESCHKQKIQPPLVPQSLFEIDPIEGKNQYPELITSICEIAVQRTFHYAPEFLKSSNNEQQDDTSPQCQGRDNILGITPEALKGVAMYAQFIEIMQCSSHRSIYQTLDGARKNLLFLAKTNLQLLSLKEAQILLTKLFLGDEADPLLEDLPSNSKSIIDELHRQIGQLAHSFISPNSNAVIYQAYIDGYQQGLTLIPREED